MIGDDICVTVVSIRDWSATLDIQQLRNGGIAGKQVLLQRDEAYQIGPSLSVLLLDVRGEKVRLGFQLPGELSLHRQEVYEALHADRPSRPVPQSPVHRTTVMLQVDQVLRIGEKLTVSPTDIDTTGVRLLVKGELLGGPNDGERVNEAKEIGPNSMMTLGALISLSLVSAADNGRAMFHVIAPANVKVSVQ